MNSDIQVNILGNAEDLQAATDEASASLDTLGASADKSAAQIDTASASAAEADPAIASTGASAEEASGGFDLLGGSMAKALLPLAALFAGFEGVKAVFEDGKQEIDQWNAANAQITNALNNTNDAIGMSVSQIDKLAESTSKNTTFTKAANLTVANSFVALSGMNKEVLPQAITLTDDLATKMAVMKGQAVPSLQQTSMAAKAMAKALESPTTATAAFARAGVTLSTAQVAQIKAIAATTDATDKQALSIKGVTAAGADALSKWSSLTAAQQTAATKADGLTAAQITAAKAFGTANAQTAAQKQLMTDLSGYVGGAATAATKTYQGQVAELKKNIDDLSGSLVGGAQEAIQGLAHDFINALPTIETIGRYIADIFKPAVDDLAKAIQTQLLPVINAHKKGLEDLIKVIAVLVAVPIAAMIAVIYVAVKAWTIMVGAIAAFIQIISDAVHWVSEFTDLIMTDAKAWGAIISQFVSNVKQWFDDLTGTFSADVKAWLKIFQDIWNDIKHVFDGATSLLYDTGKDLIQGLINGVEDMAGKAEDAVKKVGSDITSVAKKILGVFSPSTVFMEIGQNVGQGLIQGIQGTQSAVSNASGQLATAVVSGASNISAPNISAAVGSQNSSINGQANITIQGGTYQFMTAQAVQTFFSLNRDGILASKGLSLTQGATS